jgi:hypothetical protein
VISSLENAIEGVCYVESRGRHVSFAEDRDSGLAWALSHPLSVQKMLAVFLKRQAIVCNILSFGSDQRSLEGL